jgi:hypothetical protein
MAQLLMQEDILRAVTPVVDAIAHVRTKQRATPLDDNSRRTAAPSQFTNPPTPLASPAHAHIPTCTRLLSAPPSTLPTRPHAEEFHAPSGGSYGHRHSPEGRRLPPLAFSKYSLGKDF